MWAPACDIILQLASWDNDTIAQDILKEHNPQRERGEAGTQIFADAPTNPSWQTGSFKISCATGPHIKDVRKIFGFLDPLPPCPQFGLIYSGFESVEDNAA